MFPSNADQASRRARRIVDEVDPSQTFTGLTLVNRELARSFLPQFIKGLTIGTLIVVALVVAAFRSWRLSLFAMLPTAIGLVWAAGALAIAGVELDLFAVFAVVTFVGIGVDYGIHLVHRFQERGDAERATSELAPVILVAAAITMAGYGTLVWSSYPPLRSIGIVSAVSVVTLAAASVLVLPALLLTGAARDDHARGRADPGVQRSAHDCGRRRRACARAVDRVIVVDDGSTDGTGERARAAGADVVGPRRQSGERARGANGPRARLRGRIHARAAARRRPAASAAGSLVASGGSRAPAAPTS